MLVAVFYMAPWPTIIEFTVLKRLVDGLVPQFHALKEHVDNLWVNIGFMGDVWIGIERRVARLEQSYIDERVAALERRLADLGV